MRTMKTGLAALALATLGATSACSGSEGEIPATATRDDGSLTLAAALGSSRDLSSARSAFDRSGLASVLEGPGSYTVLAPTDDAFDALGETGEALMEDEDQRPILAGVLRDHMLPGHLTPEAIGEAIDRSGGPVVMTTLAGEDVTFSRSGDGVEVSFGDSEGVAFAGTATATNNGVIIPIDGVLLPAADS